MADPNTHPINKKQAYSKRIEALRSERSSFFPLWGELSDYILAFRGRFLVSDRNKGYNRNTKQINNTPRRAIRTLASGMMAGITSPARPWFRLAIPDPDLMELGDVKRWLMIVERTMREIFNQSNTYNALHALYQELGTFGTGSMGVFEDFENVIRCKTYTAGAYFLAINGKDEVDTWAREYQATVGQLVKKFGKENVSTSTLNQWKNGNTEAWVDVSHMVEPNDDRDQMSPLAKDKAFRSVYFEKGAKQDKFLRESGFDEFPILAPRWEVVGEDVYATSCPGMDGIGDSKALQLAETMKYEAMEKNVDPHMIGPETMRNAVDTGLVAGEISFVGSTQGMKLEPVYQVQINLQHSNEDIARTEARIDKTFYVDLFLMLANDSKRQPITAREVAERHEEKLLMLGPVLERLHNELLDPLIDRVFNMALRAGIFPEPPEALQGRELRVEYISVLAQAQRMVAVNAIEQFGGYVSQISAIWPEVRHKFDAAQSVDDYADALGVSPDLVVPDDKFEERVAAEAAAIERQKLAEAGPAMADSAKKLSETDTSGKSALTDMMSNAQATGAGIPGLTQ